jgi:hypothetical protein
MISSQVRAFGRLCIGLLVCATVMAGGQSTLGAIAKEGRGSCAL